MAACASTESSVIANQICWTGNIVHIENQRLPNRMFTNELLHGKRIQNKPRQRYKDIRIHLKSLKIDIL